MSGYKYAVKTIQNSPVLQRVYRLSQKEDREIYLVGGTVRDLLMGTFTGKDFDLALAGNPLNFVQALSQELSGSLVRLHEEFGQYRVVTMEGGETKTIDFSSYKGTDIESDLRERDFTINAIAINIAEACEHGDLVMVDPLGGLKDLQRKKVRLSSPSALREDPVRILRGVRIARQYKINLDPLLRAAIKEERGLLIKAAPERIGKEMFKLFDFPGIYDSLTLLDKLGILEVLIPELNAFRGYGQGKQHQYDLWEHSLKTAHKVEELLENIEDLWPVYSSFLKEQYAGFIEGEVKRSALLKYVAFLHDVGKPLTRTVEGGRVRFFEHEIAGGQINRKIAQRFRLGKKAKKYAEIVINNHMRILNLVTAPKLTQRAKYRFFRDVGNTGIDILLLSLADARATGKGVRGREEYQRIASIVDSFMEYFFKEYLRQQVKPLLSGSDIMQIFSLSEGRKIGELLTLVKEAEMQGEINSREEAVAFLKGKVECR